MIDINCKNKNDASFKIYSLPLNMQQRHKVYGKQGNWKFFLEKYEKKAFYQNCVYMVPLSGYQVHGLGHYTRINTAHFLKLNIRKLYFLLLQQGGYNELMAMMSTKRSAKIVKSMAPWVRNSGPWIGTIWHQNFIAYKVRIFTVNWNYLFLLRIIFFLNCEIQCAKCGFRHFWGWGNI